MKYYFTMTRKEVYAFYEDLKKTGKFEDFRNKHPREMTKKELELFYYDDGEYMFDPFEGSLGKVIPSTEYGPNTGLSYDKLKAIGMLKGMKTKSWPELSEEERKLFSDYLNKSNMFFRNHTKDFKMIRKYFRLLI